jgi:hypothetical protein
MFPYFRVIFFSSFMLLPCLLVNFVCDVFNCVFQNVMFVAVCSVAVLLYLSLSAYSWEPGWLRKHSDCTADNTARTAQLNSRQERQIFPFPKMLRLALGPTQSPIQWLLWVVSQGVK